MVKAMSYIGTLGVPVFFFLAGYFFSITEDSFRVFVRKKLTTIVCPWFFCFTLLWLYVTIRKGGISFTGWLLFLGGFTSSAYFITVLFFFYIVLYLGRKSRILGVVGILLSIIFYLLKDYTLLGNIDDLISSPYLNPLYWIGYFCLGMLIASTDSMKKVLNFSKKMLPISLTLSTIAIIYSSLYGSTPTYFGRYSWIMTMVSGFAMMGLSSINVYSHFEFIEKVGNCSFSIYLCHQFFSGLIIHLTELVDCWITVIVRPVANILIVMILILLYEKINKACNDKISFVGCLIGLKRRRKLE